MTGPDKPLPRPVALTIAGSDPSGGAGIQADLKTFHQFGVYGSSVLTLVTVQNTIRVEAVQPLPPELVRRQLEAVLDDIPPQAAKTGALGTAEIIATIADHARNFDFPLVVDPVMISKHGIPLMAENAREALVRRLLPQAFLVTPNLHEAALLAQMDAVEDVKAMERAAERIADLGPEAVLVKGGHLVGDAVDLLYWRGAFRRFTARRIESKHTHGTGCTYSAAITAELAKGNDLEAAIAVAKEYITRAVASSPRLGRGCGPVDHHAPVGRGQGPSGGDGAL